MIKKCLKCNHVSADWRGSETEACPGCGVIYAKGQAAMAEPPAAAIAAIAAAASTSRRSPPPRQAGHSDVPFLQRLRSESHYPTFRAVAGVMSFIGYGVGALLLIGALVNGFSSGVNGFVMGGVAVAVLIVVFSKAAKEASLMLADMSDATVRMAQRQDSASRF